MIETVILTRDEWERRWDEWKVAVREHGAQSVQAATARESFVAYDEDWIEAGRSKPRYKASRRRP